MTLKKDINKVICYLLGHKPIKVLIYGFPFGMSIISECTRCKCTTAFKRLMDMNPEESDEIYNIILEDAIEFRNFSAMKSLEALDLIRSRLEHKKEVLNL